ncbi:phosphoglucosamine mutase [Halorubrum sp. AD140]|uniref:phosphoglucosamine mutase n=1 Tax=Halorubrum sp. AD140 TaxID=3050073 RepID=UPI002ACCC1FC|nr:phosphoglucosamine mutase [Halorubrum sp. AD140]MDZ5810204.1 phosphoglucosamine mutase [Halorubrum sp. AD140]
MTRTDEGTDRPAPSVSFGTSGVRGRVGGTLTADTALSIGRAVATLGADRVVVGRDVRESGRFLLDAVCAGLTECGADVVDVGVVPTPTVARAVVGAGADAGVVVTASHNPPPDNGLKLWTDDGRAFGADRRSRVEELIASGSYEFADWDGLGRRTRRSDAAARHEEQLLASTALERDAGGTAVVVDVGNGTGRVTADALASAGCDVETLNAQRDGRFPGRPSEPTPDSCSTLSATVANTDADLGIAHDGDADRTVAVDERGRVVRGDALLALFARRAAAAGDVVTAPLNTSLAVDEALDEVGVELVRTPVGDAHVAERAAELGAAFGGEPSGAWIWPGEIPCPDGPLAACTLVELVATSGPLSTLVDDLPEHPIRRDAVPSDDLERVVADVERRLTRRYDSVTTFDGVRVETDDGWFLVRASGTQPLVRLTAEARQAQRADDLLETARQTVETAVTTLGDT